MILSAIVAASENRVIGRGNALPWNIPGDLKRFRQITSGHPIIMGRKTFESIGRPLPGRLNLVITRNSQFANSASFLGVKVCGSFEEAVQSCVHADEVFVIGGGEIYAQALPKIQKLYLTEVHCQIEGDTLFPDWRQFPFKEISRERVEGDPPYSFVLLERSF